MPSETLARVACGDCHRYAQLATGGGADPLISRTYEMSSDLARYTALDALGSARHGKNTYVKASEACEGCDRTTEIIKQILSGGE